MFKIHSKIQKEKEKQGKPNKNNKKIPLIHLFGPETLKLLNFTPPIKNQYSYSYFGHGWFTFLFKGFSMVS